MHQHRALISDAWVAVAVANWNHSNAHRLLRCKAHSITYVVAHLKVLDGSDSRFDAHDRRDSFQSPTHFGRINAERQNPDSHEIKVRFGQIQKTARIADVQI